MDLPSLAESVPYIAAGGIAATVGYMRHRTHSLYHSLVGAFEGMKQDGSIADHAKARGIGKQLYRLQGVPVTPPTTDELLGRKIPEPGFLDSFHDLFLSPEKKDQIDYMKLDLKQVTFYVGFKDEATEQNLKDLESKIGVTLTDATSNPFVSLFHKGRIYQGTTTKNHYETTFDTKLEWEGFNYVAAREEPRGSILDLFTPFLILNAYFGDRGKPIMARHEYWKQESESTLPEIEGNEVRGIGIKSFEVSQTIFRTRAEEKAARQEMMAEVRERAIAEGRWPLWKRQE